MSEGFIDFIKLDNHRISFEEVGEVINHWGCDSCRKKNGCQARESVMNRPLLPLSEAFIKRVFTFSLPNTGTRNQSLIPRGSNEPACSPRNFIDNIMRYIKFAEEDCRFNVNITDRRRYFLERLDVDLLDLDNGTKWMNFIDWYSIPYKKKIYLIKEEIMYFFGVMDVPDEIREKYSIEVIPSASFSWNMMKEALDSINEKMDMNAYLNIDYGEELIDEELHSNEEITLKKIKSKKTTKKKSREEENEIFNEEEFSAIRAAIHQFKAMSDLTHEFSTIQHNLFESSLLLLEDLYGSITIVNGLITPKIPTQYDRSQADTIFGNNLIAMFSGMLRELDYRQLEFLLRRRYYIPGAKNENLPQIKNIILAEISLHPRLMYLVGNLKNLLTNHYEEKLKRAIASFFLGSSTISRSSTINQDFFEIIYRTVMGLTSFLNYNRFEDVVMYQKRLEHGCKNNSLRYDEFLLLVDHLEASVSKELLAKKGTNLIRILKEVFYTCILPKHISVRTPDLVKLEEIYTKNVFPVKLFAGTTFKYSPPNSIDGFMLVGSVELNSFFEKFFKLINSKSPQGDTNFKRFVNELDLWYEFIIDREQLIAIQNDSEVVSKMGGNVTKLETVVSLTEIDAGVTSISKVSEMAHVIAFPLLNVISNLLTKRKVISEDMLKLQDIFLKSSGTQVSELLNEILEQMGGD
jgi:hypothetical protein